MGLLLHVRDARPPGLLIRSVPAAASCDPPETSRVKRLFDTLALTAAIALAAAAARPAAAASAEDAAPHSSRFT